MTLDDWLRSRRFLDPVARVRRRIDAAVAAVATTLPAPSDWDEYVEDFASGVPLLHGQARIDMEPAGDAVVRVVQRLASDALDAAFAEDAAVLSVQLRQDRAAPRRIVDYLLGDESWEPARGGLLRAVGWITLSAELRAVVHAFAAWRDEDRWLRRYCPTCGSLPTMAQLVGVDPGRRRLLTCGRCASQWRYIRTGCPFCEAESHRLASVGVEDQGGLRIDYCEACRAYLKTYSGQGDEHILLADWTSLHLDVIARDRGLHRMAASLYELEPAPRDAPPECRTDSGGPEARPGSAGRAAIVH